MIEEHLIEILLVVGIALVPAIILHEYAHGWVANRLGDPTAKLLGRLTFNPLKHIDPVGSVIIPGLLLFAYLSGWTRSLLLFGWAKPVPVNFSRLRQPRRDMMLVAAAGPAINILLALLLALVLRSGLFPSVVNAVLFWAIQLNLVLAVFNMVPIPPLDGSRIISGLLPREAAIFYNRLEPYGILFVLILLQLGFLRFIYPIVDMLTALLGVRP